MHEEVEKAFKESAQQGREPDDPLPFKLRILTANDGKVVIATVQLEHLDDNYFVSNTGNASIAGVPGTSAPVKIDAPLGENTLTTGDARNKIQVDGKEVGVEPRVSKDLELTS